MRQLSQYINPKQEHSGKVASISTYLYKSIKKRFWETLPATTLARRILTSKNSKRRWTLERLAQLRNINLSSVVQDSIQSLTLQTMVRNGKKKIQSYKQTKIYNLQWTKAQWSLPPKQIAEPNWSHPAKPMIPPLRPENTNHAQCNYYNLTKPSSVKIYF